MLRSFGSRTYTGIRARTKKLFTRKPMGISAKLNYAARYPGHWATGKVRFFAGMAKITTPSSTNQMTRFIQHIKERYVNAYSLGVCDTHFQLNV